jgi:hypothetical protein
LLPLGDGMSRKVLAEHRRRATCYGYKFGLNGLVLPTGKADMRVDGFACDVRLGLWPFSVDNAPCPLFFGPS